MATREAAMNKILFVLVMGSALVLAACGKPAPIESVESLVANPDRNAEEGPHRWMVRREAARRRVR